MNWGALDESAMSRSGQPNKPVEGNRIFRKIHAPACSFGEVRFKCFKANAAFCKNEITHTLDHARQSVCVCVCGGVVVMFVKQEFWLMTNFSD
jgi:hypothetical protein